MSNQSVRTFISRFDNGDFQSANTRTQCDAGWYDWFCRDSSLVRKTESLGKKVKQLAESSLVDLDKMYVFFKNNCPMSGPLYDDFRFCDIETGNVIYTVVPKSGHSGKAELWGQPNNFEGPIVKGTWKEIKNYFGV